MFTTRFLTRIATLAAVFLLALSNVQLAYATPANDNFVDATQITSLPFSVNANTTGATFEADEPIPSCWWGYPLKTVWFAYTPTTNVTVTARATYFNFPPLLAIYQGDALNNLNQMACGNYDSQHTFQAQAGDTYYFQLSSLYDWYEGIIPFSLEFTPPPEVSIYHYPDDPNIYDNVWFDAWVNDPIGIETIEWDFGDGTTSNSWALYHQFAADGDYTVNLTATTYDGRTGSASRVVQVRTHDVAITSFSLPQTARANQTRTINVDVKNKRYSENVEVLLIKGLPGGNERQIGILTLYVPARASRPTTFKFSYTFTADDATVGKVTFKAVATIVNARDALPSDNIAIGTTKVSK